MWKVLKAVIREHDEGLCDKYCRDFRRLARGWQDLNSSIAALVLFGYLKGAKQVTDAWQYVPPLYKLDWDFVKQRLGIDPPPAFRPLTPESLKQPVTLIGDNEEADENLDLTKWIS